MRISKNMIVGAVVTAGIVGPILYYAIPKKDKIKVKSLIWVTDIDVQEYKDVEESGWTVPDGATILASVTKEASEVDVRDGSIRNPYRPYYTYRIKKWVTVDTKTVTGYSSEKITYGNTEGLPEGKIYANKREGYYMIDENGTRWFLDASKFSVLKEGDEVIVSHNRCSQVVNTMEVIK